MEFNSIQILAMNDAEKKVFTSSQISEILKKVNINIPDDISKLDESYISHKIIMDAHDGKYTYSTFAISNFLRELEIDYQKILACDFRENLKELFAEEISISAPDNNFFKKTISSVSGPFSKRGRSESKNVDETQKIPSNFSEAVTLYNEIRTNERIEPLKEDCDVRRDIDIYFTSSFGQSTGVAITKSDEIWLIPPLQLNTDFFILVPADSNKPVVWGKFHIDENYYYLTALSENVRVSVSDTNTNYKLIFSNVAFTRFFSRDIKVYIKSLPVVDEVLCIDFGTSNTTAGTWTRTADGAKPEIVKFDDLTKPALESSPFLPSIAYLKDLRSDKHKFLFGYEAKKHIIDNDYDPAGNIFYNIKQWIVAEDDYKITTGTDEYGEECERYDLFAKDIIIEFIKYIIVNAEIKLKRKCRRLHFSAPVKCKHVFNTFLTKKFKTWKNEYEILSADKSLDEAIAIIYKRISELKTEFEYNPSAEKGELMVIDCGGGTTDAANCSYQFSKTNTGTKIDIITKFENGQTTFGGNDLTYRIFQFLKIRLRDYYCKLDNAVTTSNILNSLERFDCFDEITGKKTNESEDFFTHIDNGIRKKQRFDCYDQLDMESQKAEWIIPTDFNNKNIIGTGDVNPKLARRNFNYLWQLAEQWKIALYSEDATFTIDFNKRPKTLQINSESKKIYFYINRSDIEKENKNNEETKSQEKETEVNKTKIWKLDKVGEVPEISLNREELIALLKPQIYYLLSVMFLKADGTERTRNELPSKSRKLHLSGQSCRISLFQDMLKEFVPGKELRGHTKNETAEQKKLACVEGCILYLSDTAYGKVSVKIKTDMPNIIYTVTVARGTGTQQETLLEGGKIYMSGDIVNMPEIMVHKREMNTGWMRINVYNNLTPDNDSGYWKDLELRAYFPDGRDVENIEELKQEIIANAPENFDQWENSDRGCLVLEQLIEKLKHGATDVLLIFAIPNKDGFSFTLWQILKYKQKSGDGEIELEKFRIMGSDNLQYQRLECTTRFEGQNCK